MRRITWFTAGPLKTSGIFITLFFSTLFYFGIYAIKAVNAAFKVVDNRLQILQIRLASDIFIRFIVRF